MAKFRAAFEPVPPFATGSRQVTGSRGREWTFAVVLAAAATALLCITFAAGSTPDEEEFRFAILSAWLRVRSLAEGHHGFWTPLLGLGVPQPFVPNFSLHPLAPLLAWLSPVAWVRALLVVHTVAGAAGMWRLGTVLALRPAVRATGVVTFLLAAPVQNYVLSDFWPSHYVAWTLIPWLLLAAWRVLSSDTVHVRRWSGALGLTAGIVATNANPAYVLVFAPLAVAVVVTHARMACARWRWLAIALLLALAIAAPNAAELASERRFFAPELALSNVTDPLRFRAAVTNAFAPVSVDAVDVRSFFVGVPYAVLALAGTLWFARSRMDLVLGAAIAALMLFTRIPMPWVSQRYQFRDPITVCAILLAGLALNALWARRGFRPAAAIVLALQVASVTYGAWPVFQRVTDDSGRRAVAYHGATGDTPLVDHLVSLLRAPGRVAYSPQVDYDVSERALVADGIGVNALAYRGIPVLNGSFKSASTDVVWPDERLFYGRIRLPHAAVASSLQLDVLGVRYVLARRGETVANDLTELGSFATGRGGELLLLENRNAWPEAFLVPPSIGDEDVPRLPQCAHDRLLCRDLSAIAAHRDPADTTVVRHEGAIHVRWTPTREPRVLVVTEMFRPEWVAYADGRPMPTRRMFGALLGVPLPSGVTGVELRYRASALLLATLVSYAALTAGLVLAVVPGNAARRY